MLRQLLLSKQNWSCSSAKKKKRTRLMKKIIFSVLALSLLSVAHAQKVAPLWKDFVDAKKNNRTPVLPDFSYAGYHWSEKEIPSVAGKKHFKVTDFGAIPD